MEVLIKFCFSDLILISLFKECLDELLFVIIWMINLLLEEGKFFFEWKGVFVKLKLKKVDFDLIKENFWLFSNF